MTSKAETQADKAQEKPQTIGELVDLALEKHRGGDFNAAAEIYIRVLHHQPGNAMLWTNLGAARRSQGKLDAAIACHMRSMALDPANKSAPANLCNALRDSGRYEEARYAGIASHAGFHTGRAALVARDLAGMGRWRASLKAFDKAIEEDPDDGELRLLRATSHFMIGDYEKGFADYAWRFAHSPQSEPKRESPRWRGGEIAGEKLLVFAEQGLGDAILISRFFPKLKEQWKEVWIGARKPTMRLFEDLPHVDKVFDRDALPPEGSEDAHVASMDLMPIFKLTPTNCPPPVSLNIPADSRERATKLLAPFAPFFKVGISWAGSPTFVNAARKAADLSWFLELAKIPRVQLFGLTKGEAEADIARLGAEALIVNTAATDRDLADAAAVIDGLDLVVTVDTSIAHLAAALGKPTWVTMMRPSFWYWGPMGESTYWYRNMRLIRQTKPNDWSAPFEMVKADIENAIT